MLSIRTILHPTDFSPQSGDAFNLARSLARDHAALLIVLHVVPPPAVLYGEVVTPFADSEARDGAQKALEGMVSPHDDIAVVTRLEDGEPAARILDVARETHTDLIVVGTHGRTGLGRLLMGSVAEELVRKAPCPVLTVRAPFAEEGMAPPPREAAMA